MGLASNSKGCLVPEESWSSLAVDAFPENSTMRVDGQRLRTDWAN
jgi:hypothetical protein